MAIFEIEVVSDFVCAVSSLDYLLSVAEADHEHAHTGSGATLQSEA